MERVYVNRILGTLLLASLASFASVGSTAAQGSKDAALVRIPFRFIIDGKLLPAGSYQIWSESSDWQMMNIAKADSKTILATVRTWPVPNPEPGRKDVHVEFKNYYGQYFLQWVQLPLHDVHEVKLSQKDVVSTLARLNLMQAEPVDVAK